MHAVEGSISGDRHHRWHRPSVDTVDDVMWVEDVAYAPARVLERGPHLGPHHPTHTDPQPTTLSGDNPWTTTTSSYHGDETEGTEGRSGEARGSGASASGQPQGGRRSGTQARRAQQARQQEATAGRQAQQRKRATRATRATAREGRDSKREARQQDRHPPGERVPIG